MANLSGKFFGIDMTSPSFLRSGPLSYNAEGLLAAFHAGAGRVTTKTLRLKKAINPIPHIALPSSSNLRGSILNTEKWSDFKWEQWVEEEFQKLVGHPGVLIASISHTAPEPEVITSPVEKTGVVNLIECVAHTKDTLVPVERAMRARTDLPELAKLTFHWGDDLYRAAEEARETGANGLTVIDSIGSTLVIDIETYQPVLGGIRNQAWMPGAASDFGFPMTLAHSDQKTLNQIQGVVTTGVPFFKVYTTYDGFLLEDHQLLDSMLAVKAAGGLMKVHAENYAIIKHKQKPFLTAGYTPPHFHPLSRPEIAEAEAIHPFLPLGEITGVHLHIMHVSSASGANEVAWARARGQVIVGDTCPQYLLLTEKEYQRAGFEGFKFVCSLPLRKNSDQTALWKTLSLGDLKTIGIRPIQFYDHLGVAGKNMLASQCARSRVQIFH